MGVLYVPNRSAPDDSKETGKIEGVEPVAVLLAVHRGKNWIVVNVYYPRGPRTDPDGAKTE